ncbi:WD40-repeat-containing domain protein [Cladochytrium replicatum]|nr:WD40-repeat-containing domain protein [Cladochytrium replicatum]
MLATLENRSLHGTCKQPPHAGKRLQNKSSSSHSMPVRVFGLGTLIDTSSRTLGYPSLCSQIVSRRFMDLSLENVRSVAKMHRGPVNALEITENGRYMLSAGSDASIHIYDLALPERTGTYVKEHLDSRRTRSSHLIYSGIIARDDPVTRFSNRPSIEEDIKAARFDDNVIESGRNWGFEKEIVRPVASVSKENDSNHQFSVTGVQWYPHDQGLFTSSSMDSTVRVWDTAALEPVFTFNIGHKVYTHALSPQCLSHSLIAVASEDPLVRLCDMNSGALAHTLRGHSGSVVVVRWSTTDEFLLASGGTDGTIRLWDVRKARACLLVLDRNGSDPGSRDRSSMRLDQFRELAKATKPAPKTLSSSSRNASIAEDDRLSDDRRKAGKRKHYEVAKSTEEMRVVGTRRSRTFAGSTSSMISGSAKPQLTHHASAPAMSHQSDEDSWWDENLMMSTNRTVPATIAPTAHRRAVNGLTFTSDGGHLISCGLDDQLRLWDVHNGHNTLTNYGSHLLNGQLATVLPAITPVSRSQPLRVSSDDPAMITSKQSGAGVCGGLCNPPLVMQPSDDRNVLVFELYTGRLIARLTGHMARVGCIAIRPGFEEVYTGGTDHQILVWRSQKAVVHSPLVEDHLGHGDLSTYNPAVNSALHTGMFGDTWSDDDAE